METHFTHDCDHCTPFGKYEWKGEKYDLYVCVGGGILGNECFIARYGNEGSEYMSASEDIVPIEHYEDRPEGVGHPLVECKKRYQASKEEK